MNEYKQHTNDDVREILRKVHREKVAVGGDEARELVSPELLDAFVHGEADEADAQRMKRLIVTKPAVFEMVRTRLNSIPEPPTLVELLHFVCGHLSSGVDADRVRYYLDRPKSRAGRWARLLKRLGHLVAAETSIETWAHRLADMKPVRSGLVPAVSAASAFSTTKAQGPHPTFTTEMGVDDLKVTLFDQDGQMYLIAESDDPEYANGSVIIFLTALETPPLEVEVPLSKAPNGRTRGMALVKGMTDLPKDDLDYDCFWSPAPPR